MHFVFVFLLAVLNFGSLKTEPIDYDRNHGQFNVMLPPRPNEPKDLAPVESDWNNLDFQPNELTMRKPVNIEDGKDHESEVFEPSEEHFKPIDQLNDEQFMRLSNYLVKILERPGEWEAPLVLVRNTPEIEDKRMFPPRLDNLRGVSKRSRVYQAYPWRNARSYKYENYNPCTPSKHDVFQLLKALHEQRQGNKTRFVSFCNRTRPAKSVFTNIRFLGRRRK